MQQYVDINMWMSADAIPSLEGQGTRARWALARSLGLLPHGLGKLSNTRYSIRAVEDLYNEDDMRNITIGAMQQYLGSQETNLNKLWVASLEKALAWDISEFEEKGRDSIAVDPNKVEAPSETTVQQPGASKDDDSNDLKPAY